MNRIVCFLCIQIFLDTEMKKVAFDSQHSLNKSKSLTIEASGSACREQAGEARSFRIHSSANNEDAGREKCYAV